MKRYVATQDKSGSGRRYFEWLGDAGALTSEVAVLNAPPWAGGQQTGQREQLSQTELAAPVAPSKIVCVGRNYRAHAAELAHPVPTEPLFFFKPPSSLLAPGGAVELPPESERVDHEAELTLVIGKRGRRIAREHALDHVFGLTIACDVTARDLQTKDGQWARAKGFDGFCPLGPFVTTSVDPNALGIRLSVGSALRQDGSTSDMVFDAATLVAAASAFLTLEPGDLILTGTPAGVGPLASRDQVHIAIDHLGQLRFSVA